MWRTCRATRSAALRTWSGTECLSRASAVAMAFSRPTTAVSNRVRADTESDPGRELNFQAALLHASATSCSFSAGDGYRVTSRSPFLFELLRPGCLIRPTLSRLGVGRCCRGNLPVVGKERLVQHGRARLGSPDS